MTPRTAKGPAVKIDESWHVEHTTKQDYTANSLLFDVPDDEEWQIVSVVVVYDSSVVVGNRQIALSIQQPTGSPIFWMAAGVVQPASQSYLYELASGLPYLTALIVGNVVTVPIPAVVLKPEDQILVYDETDVDDTTDGLTVDIQYLYRKI